jgi:hypothetical protein
MIATLPLEASLANKINRLLAYESFCAKRNSELASSKPGYGTGAIVPYTPKVSI